MKQFVTLDYEQALDFAHKVKVAVLKEMGREYKDLTDGRASGVDCASQYEVDQLFQ